MKEKPMVHDNINYDNQNIKDIEISKEIRSAFLDYSMSVIVSRALPDVRDGLKPVHRRILYAMYKNGLTNDKPYRKCATTVGEVLGHYHPHGDASVYDALVRLAQDFSMRHILVDGHGNFGSVDGDPAAAYRYTEARMSKVALKMLDDIKKDTVDWSSNFDDTEMEPQVLPTKFPNLLVNGSSGIAVGMATNIPPHNMREVVSAVCHLINNPDAEVEELMEFIKGPDFPTHGIIMGTKGIKEAYKTGRGKIYLRARAEIEEASAGRDKIVVTELPYGVIKRRLIVKIADLVKDKRIEGIADINDYSSQRTGMQLEIKCKKDANAQVILNQLYKMTEMQTTFGAILLALDHGVPKVLTLKQILQKYIEFQKEVIRRRTEYDLKQAQDKAHILEGLAKAIDIVDDIIATIRACKGGQSEAKQTIMDKFGFDEPQADAIVKYRLGQLAGLEIEKILNDLEELHKTIAKYNEILSSDENIFKVVKTELIEVAEKFGDERRTEISPFSGDVEDESLIPEEESIITLTNHGYVKRMNADLFRAQGRGGHGVKGMSKKEEDDAKSMIICSSHDQLLMFTDKGTVFRIKGYQIPECSRTAKGLPVINIIPIEKGENVTAIVNIPKDNDYTSLCMVTKKGIIKRSELKLYDHIRKTGIRAITLDEGDELSWAALTDGEQNLVIATHDGKAICFKETDARYIGRTAHGVRAIKLRDDDYVVGFAVATEGQKLLTITETGYGRKSEFSEYRVQNRGGSGIINYKTEKYGKVALVASVCEDNDVVMVSSEGVTIRVHIDSISTFSRTSKGVRVMKVKDNEKLVTFSITDKEEEQVEATEENTEAVAETQSEE